MHPYFPMSKLALPTSSRTLCGSTSIAEAGSTVVLDGATVAALQGLLAAALKPVREDLSRTWLLGQHMVFATVGWHTSRRFLPEF